MAVLLAACAIAGCGSAGSRSAGSTVAHRHPVATTAPGTTTVAPVATTAAPPEIVPGLAAAERPHASQFPPAAGRSLARLERSARGLVQIVPATGTFTPGRRRFAFGLTTSSGRFVYAPTALYLAPTRGGPALGPFPAAADPMGVPAADRSEQNAAPNGLKAIYAAELPLPHAGTYSILGFTRTRAGLIESLGEVAVAAASPIPDVGGRPPLISTDTPASVHGRLSVLTTRLPPEHMNQVSFAAAYGHEPIALLFSTPSLCVSRVCGPVTDVVVSLQHEFAGRVAFIHQEIYVGDDPAKGFRAPMRAFHLQTEPWLFTIDRRGVITARLEGAFGVRAARAAIESALR